MIAGEVAAGAAVERRVERPRWFRVTVAAGFLVVAAIAASGGADSLAGPSAQSGIVLIHLPGDAAAAAVEGPSGAHAEIERAVREFQPRAILPAQVEPNPGLRWGATGMIALGTAAILISTVGWVVIVRRTSPMAHPPFRGDRGNVRWE